MKRALFALLLIVLLITPTLGQDAPTLPAEVTDAALSNFGALAWILVGVLIIAIITIALVAFALIYRSAPPAVAGILAEIGRAGLGLAESVAKAKADEAALNTVDWDDPLWAELLKLMQTKRAELETLINESRQ